MALPFVNQRRQRWDRLEQLLTRIERQGLKTLSTRELMEFSVIYRQTATDLARAKSERMNQTVVNYLNQLVSRAYNHIYVSETTSWRQFKRLLTHDFPALVRQHCDLIAVAFGLLTIGWLAGFAGYLLGPEIISQWMPPGFSTEILNRYQSNQWFNDPLVNRPYLAARIIYNNLWVAVKAFAGGMLCGVYTGLILGLNGFMLGVTSALFWQNGYFFDFWAMILPHGILELSAFCLAGAGGLLLARSLLFPGEYRRADALKSHGGAAAQLFAGTAVLLVIAGLIEGFLSTINVTAIAAWIRLAFAGATAFLLLGYFRLGAPGQKQLK